MLSDVATKSDFAALMGVTPGRVSQWISEKKIHGQALEGEGRGAKINVGIAKQQLGRNLDVVQTQAQRPVLQAAPIDEDQARFNKARADKMALEAEEARRRMEADKGRYTLTDEVKRDFFKALTAGLQAQQEWFGDLAGIISRELGVDAKAVAVLLRREFRAFCQKRSDLAMAQLAETVTLSDDPDLKAATTDG